MELLDLLDPKKKCEIQRFVDASRHCTDNVTEITHMKWIADAMELMAQTPLSNDQKKKLVVALYSDLSKDDTNTFKDTFDANSAIEFIWDASHDKFGVIVRRKGCFTNCLPCCSDASVVMDKGVIKVSLNPVVVPSSNPVCPATTTTLPPVTIVIPESS